MMELESALDQRDQNAIFFFHLSKYQLSPREVQ